MNIMMRGGGIQADNDLWRLCVQAASSAFFAREEGLRQEVSSLEDRIRALEDEKTELIVSSTDHTRPLMRYHIAHSKLCSVNQRPSCYVLKAHLMGPIKCLAVMEAAALECLILDSEALEMTPIRYTALVRLLPTEYTLSARLDPQQNVFQN